MPAVPERPRSAKFELTLRCNLRCGFCYTDSPRRTVERAPELDDATWLRIVDESIELGVAEAVVTGGEPLLRRDLALAAIERLDAAGIAVTLNTNGWFIDERVASGLARFRKLRIHVSVDGPTPELHDAGRGLRGSWERAVGAADLLLSSGARVKVLHVVTPANERALPEFLDSMWLLGVPAISLTPIVPVGAAARSGRWAVNRLQLHRRVRAFETRTGGDPRIEVHNRSTGRLSTPRHAPAAFLVRPNGAFLVSSNHPFSFGDASEQSLAECWRSLRRGWSDERIRTWIDGVPGSRRLATMEVVPYRDDDVVIVSSGKPGNGEHTDGRGSPADLARIERALKLLDSKAPLAPVDGMGDLDSAKHHVRRLALGRRYQSCAPRIDEDGDGVLLVRVPETGRTARVNGTARIVLAACENGSPADAVEALARIHPGVSGERLERDVLGAVRQLVRASILLPAPATS